MLEFGLGLGVRWGVRSGPAGTLFRFTFQGFFDPWLLLEIKGGFEGCVFVSC
jgi:hypothetical protein